MLLAIGACGRSHGTPANVAPPHALDASTGTTRVAPSPAVPRGATQDAAVATDAAISHHADAGSDEIDLLRVTEATVTVSSVVANATDRPANLVDGDLATAWSSVTGEMERTWILVHLPRSARVRGIELTAGYTRASATRDLFTSNVRISRVRVLHDGAVIGEFAVDPGSRALQRIAVQGDGGDWRIETVGLVPGSERGWREVSVSELRVIGAPGSDGRRATPAAPGVGVSTVTSRDVPGALREARRALLGEGLHPREGEYGCSGSYATLCVRGAWLDIVDAAVTLAETRCGAEVAARVLTYQARRRVLTQANERMARQLESEHSDTADALDTPADDALGRTIDAALEVFARCPRVRGFDTLGPILEGRDATALSHYRFRE